MENKNENIYCEQKNKKNKKKITFLVYVSCNIFSRKTINLLSHFFNSFLCLSFYSFTFLIFQNKKKNICRIFQILPKNYYIT